MNLDRRDFLTATAAGAATFALGSRVAQAAADAADLRIAVIGVRGQGDSHIHSLGKNVVALCDVDASVLAERAAQCKERLGRAVDTFSDYRKLLERDDIDGVSIATPNHTHCLLAIAAIEAGKHVYVEKPVSHNIWEGRQLVAAARKHGRVVQCGTQSRSSPGLQQAVAWVQSGALGKTRYAVGTCYKPRKAVPKRSEPLPIPDSIDYDLWCGPAEKRALLRSELHYDWHWDWNTGNGDMGNQGIHQMDIARWFLGESGLAPRSISIGGRLGYDDAGNTPNTQVVLHDYAAAPLVFETRGLPRSLAAQSAWGESMDRYRGAGVGVIVQCEKGHVLIPSYTEAIAYDLDGQEVKRFEGGGGHHANWLDAVAAGDPSRLNADIGEGHVSSALCHVGGVSHRLGSKATAAAAAERIVGNDLLSDAFERMASHLRANAVDVDSEPVLTLGDWLDVDPATETFSGNDAAVALRRRKCRAPFVVPDYGA
ncbi:MAG: Gfo/Idh/MocA family protein [Lacipirellulaceae bacterium]